MSGEDIKSALRKAGSTALRDMRAEAKKRVREKKRLKAKAVSRVLHIQRPSRMVVGLTSEWALNVEGGTVRLSDYPFKQKYALVASGGLGIKTVTAGVAVSVNKGRKPTLLKSAFVATMASGHRGVFIRRGAARLPIKEPVASRPVDALLQPGQAQGVAERGARAFQATFLRLAPGAYEMFPNAKQRIE